jgi:hypothetical protein
MNGKVKKPSKAQIAARIREAALRAKTEAEARRAKEADKPVRPEEIGGRSGPDPTRYGDWEKKGIVTDF